MYNCNIKEVKKIIDIHIILISSLYGDSFWWKMTLFQCYVILKISFGSADLQSNAEVYDKEQNCNNNVTDSVTRSAMQTNLESGFTFQDMSPAKTSSGQNRISFFFKHKWFHQWRHFLWNRQNLCIVDAANEQYL